jgi:hypothetical protein
MAFLKGMFIKTITIYFFFTTIIFLIFFSGCKKEITDPGIIEEQKVIKTPREMTWTADTLTSPDPGGGQLMMENILVFSTSDVWVCGWNDVARGLIWHYDGKKWSESNIMADVGGMRVSDIAGYSSNDLWAAGYSGENIFLAHYNGQHWTRADDMGIKGELLDMCKDPNGNLWACGRNGVIMKYDKTKWIADTIDHLNPSTQCFIPSINFFNKNISFLVTTINNTTLKQIYYFYEKNDKGFSIIDSMRIGIENRKWGDKGLSVDSLYGNIYSYGQMGIWINNSGIWNNILSVSGSMNGMCCLKNDYLIAVGDFQKIFFYNGQSWNAINDLFHISDPNFVFANTWTNGFETFIIGFSSQSYPTKTIIFHGK